MDALINAVTVMLISIGVVTCLAAGIVVAGLFLAYSCTFFKEKYLEWSLVVAVINEAKVQGRSIFKKRHGAGE
jgi:hypothetical protein